MDVPGTLSSPHGPAGLFQVNTVRKERENDLLKEWTSLQLVKGEQGEWQWGAGGAAATERLPFLDAVVPLSHFLRPSLPSPTFAAGPRSRSGLPSLHGPFGPLLSLVWFSEITGYQWIQWPLSRLVSRDLRVWCVTADGCLPELIFFNTPTPQPPAPASYHITRTENQRATKLQGDRTQINRGNRTKYV